MKLTQVCLLASVLSACSMIPKQDPTQNIDVANSAQAISTSENLDDTQDSGPEFSSAQAENTIVDAPTLDVWGRIIHNLALTNNVDNPRVDKHLSWFVRHPQHVKKVSERAQRYLFHISAEVEALTSSRHQSAFVSDQDRLKLHW